MVDTVKKLLYTHNLSIQWADMDALGHVNNTAYFVYMQEARVAWLAQLGFKVNTESNLTPVVVKTDCTYVLPMVYPADISVKMYGGKLGRSSLPLFYEICCQHNPETMYAHGHATLVWVDLAQGRSVPLPDKVRYHYEQ